MEYGVGSLGYLEVSIWDMLCRFVAWVVFANGSMCLFEYFYNLDISTSNWTILMYIEQVLHLNSVYVANGVSSCDIVIIFVYLILVCCRRLW